MEEDIEHLKEIKENFEYSLEHRTSLTNEEYLNAHRKTLAIKNILNELDRLKKENKELKNMQCEFLGTGCKREMKELQKNYIYYKNLANEYQGSCIPKQVIRDKLDLLTKRSNIFNYDNEIHLLEELLGE